MRLKMKTGLQAGVVALAVFCGCQTAEADPKPSSVIVTNPAANPVPITAPSAIPVKASDNPAFQPYQVEDDAGVISPNGYYKTATFDVPAGKRLVIEFVSILVYLDSGDNLQEAVVNVSKPGGGVITHSLTRTATGASNGCVACGTFTVTQPLHLYCEAGIGALKVQTQRVNTTGLYKTAFSVSGYLVDLP